MTQSRSPSHLSSVAQIAVSTLVAQGQYGAMTDISKEHGIRRQKLYELRNRANTALDAEFTPKATLPGTFMLEVTPVDMQRAVIALRVVTPASIRDIVEILPVLFGKRWSYGTVWSTLHEAEQRAAGFLGQVDLAGIHSIALDEMFSQGRPVLAGIDLDTQYLFQLEVTKNRDGETWAASLGSLRDNQSLNPDCVVKDAGSGLAAGVKMAWKDIEERDDLFHATYLLGGTAYHLERRAYSTIELVDKLRKKRKRAKTEKTRRRFGRQALKKMEHMNSAIDRYDRFEALRREALRVLQLTDWGSGKLRTSAEVTEVLTLVGDAMEGLGGRRARKAGGYLRNRAEGLGRYLDKLAKTIEGVTSEAGGSVIVEAMIRAYQASLRACNESSRWKSVAHAQEVEAATVALLYEVGPDLQRLTQVAETVLPLLAQRHRASSAIENLNSVLRPYLVVQKHAEQGFLNLFQFYWNMRKRQWGRWKGSSPYGQLTGKKVTDWLTQLGYATSEEHAHAA